MIVDYKKEDQLGKKSNEKKDQDEDYVVNVLIYVSKASTVSKVVSALKPCDPKEEGEMRVVPCFLNLIHKISAWCLPLKNDDLRPYDNRMEIHRRIKVKHLN